MTALTDSIPWAVHVKAIDAQTSESGADDRARQIVKGIERGEETAFTELYDCYQRRLQRFALALTHGEETLAHEIVQSTFLTAAAKLRNVQSEEHLWNWLASVARQHLGKVWRHRRREDSVVSMADVPEHMSFESDKVLEERLDAALLALDESERQFIEWFYFDGHSHKDIAERTGATPKAVSSRLERARARLRSLIAGTK